MEWEISTIGRIPKLRDAVLIEGLPGIGNVGKLAVDFLIQELKPKKIYEFFSYSFPHSVFVNEQNLVDLPKIEMYYTEVKGVPLLLLAGDTQPIDEVSSYHFSNEVLNLAQKLGTKEIITIGGIGLSNVPMTPQVFCTGNCKDIVKRYTAGTKINNKIFGVVGPIVGVSGLLVGLSTKKNMKAVSLLAETYGHPMYMGFRGAKEVIHVLNNKFELGLDTRKLDREIKKIEEVDDEDVADVAPKPKRLPPIKGMSDMNYIG
jgi:uncharacterized protein (TIGR00162 family)